MRCRSCVSDSFSPSPHARSYHAAQRLGSLQQRLEVLGAEAVQVVEQFVEVVDRLAEGVVLGREAADGLVGSRERGGGGVEELEVRQFALGVAVAAGGVEQGADAPFAEVVLADEDVRGPEV